MKYELCGENVLFKHGGIKKEKPIIKLKNLTAAKLMYVFIIRAFIVCSPPPQTMRSYTAGKRPSCVVIIPLSGHHKSKKAR